jgi:hypothetical protein
MNAPSQVHAPHAVQGIVRSGFALLVATAFIAAWVDPASLSQDAMLSLRATLVLEMLALHSGAFLGFLVIRAGQGGPRRMASSMAIAVPVMALYVIAGWNFSREVQSWWPLVACLWLVAGRVLPLARRDRAAHSAVIRTMIIEWLLALGWFITMMVAVRGISLPLMGLDGIDAASYPFEAWSGGLTLVHEVQWGALHFSGLALLPWIVPGVERALALQTRFGAPRG